MYMKRFRLSGKAAIKTKNVCLHLADDHTYLTKSGKRHRLSVPKSEGPRLQIVLGIVQLFYQPHPPRAVTLPYWAKIPPKVQTSLVTNQRSRDRSNPSTSNVAEANKSDEDVSSKGFFVEV